LREWQSPHDLKRVSQCRQATYEEAKLREQAAESEIYGVTKAAGASRNIHISSSYIGVFWREHLINNYCTISKRGRLCILGICLNRL
jgi:hypothetical protein